MSINIRVAGAALGFTMAAACSGEAPDSGAKQTEKPADAASGLSIEFEKYTLDNGLDVVLHVDRSDPVVAIDLAAHVGSAREVEGRTGFAHLFEHLLFMDSENLGYGGLDEMNTRIGGEGTNGFTSHDMTQYFQAVPSDALEKVIWAEADKLGFFINTVTQGVIDNEKQVVKNEKRQRVDNRPYGHNNYIINKALYPADHPYNWQVIGSLEDVEAATLQDVKDFYARWYVPNNVTVTIAGDFDVAEAKRWVEKYFGEIPRGEDVVPLAPRAGVLEETKSFYHEDNFARAPQLTMVWPTVEQYHADSYALSILGAYLTEGKRAPFNQVLIDEQKLSTGMVSYLYAKELAGEFYLIASVNQGEDIDALTPGIEEAFARFEESGIPQADLDRIKAGLEAGFYENMQSVLGKSISLGEYNLFANDPGFIVADIENTLAVTREDVMRVYETYIKGKPFIATSFVPKGEPALALEGAIKADIVEEKIVAGEGAPVDFDPTVRDFEPTPSSFDRTIEPDFGKLYALPTPVIWRDALDNGVQVYGIENSETPLIQFSLYIDAGRNRGDVAKPAVAALTADLMNKGTADKTVAELEDAIGALGSELSVSSGSTGAYVSGTTLARNFDKTIALAEEMLLEPRWDGEEFELLKSKRMQELEQAKGNPNAIASREMRKLHYGEDHLFGYGAYGEAEQLEGVTLADLKAFYDANFTPEGAKLRVVGMVDEAGVSQAFSGIASRWTGEARQAVSLPLPRAIEQSRIYFYDVPGAKQSVLSIQRPSLAAVDEDYPLAQALNFMLGGNFTSRLNTELRINRGYTYGARSRFTGSEDRGFFAVSTSVRTNVTRESIELIREIVSGYGSDFSDDDLVTMKGALLRGQALETETLGAKLGVLGNISSYGFADDYKAQNAARIEAMTLEEFKALAEKHLDIDAMNWLLVGDAETQAGRLGDLGFGDVIMLGGDE